MDNSITGIILAIILVLVMIFIYKRFAMPWLNKKAFPVLENNKWLKIAAAIVVTYLLTAFGVFILIFKIVVKITDHE